MNMAKKIIDEHIAGLINDGIFYLIGKDLSGNNVYLNLKTKELWVRKGNYLRLLVGERFVEYGLKKAV